MKAFFGALLVVASVLGLAGCPDKKSENSVPAATAAASVAPAKSAAPSGGGW